MSNLPKLYQQMTKISCRIFVSSIQRILMLLFFTMGFFNGAMAQNSCNVTGVGLTPEAIVTCAVPAAGPLLTYQANPSLASTFSWSISTTAPNLNTSGAFIVGSTTGQTVTVNPGPNSGSFFLVCTVTQIAPPNAFNSCAVSVAVFKPEVFPVAGSRCGPGTVTIGTTGCTLMSGNVSSTVRWWDAPVGGNMVHTGTTFTPNLLTTTSYWVECDIMVTPQLPSLPFNCISPRVEVVATVNSVSATMSAPTAPPQCGTAGNTVSGTITGGVAPFTCTASFDAAGTGAGWSVTDCSVVGNNITITYTTGTSVLTVLTVSVTDADGCEAVATVNLDCGAASQGCSPGFWKNHTRLWDQASDFVVSGMPGVMGNMKFTTNTSFISYFGLSAAWASANGFPANITMLGAISQGGGQCKSLSRHAVSALLASGGGLSIPYPAGSNDFASLYIAIKAALLSGNCGGTFGSQLATISAQDHAACGELKRLYGSARPENSRGMMEISNRGNQINIFPNPAEKYVNITFVPASTDNSSILLYDRNGNLVSNVYNGMAEEGNTYQRTIDTRSLSTGVYIIKFQNGNTISNKKLVINK